VRECARHGEHRTPPRACRPALGYDTAPGPERLSCPHAAFHVKRGVLFPSRRDPLVPSRVSGGGCVRHGPRSVGYFRPCPSLWPHAPSAAGGVPTPVRGSALCVRDRAPGGVAVRVFAMRGFWWRTTSFMSRRSGIGCWMSDPIMTPNEATASPLPYKGEVRFRRTPHGCGATRHAIGRPPALRITTARSPCILRHTRQRWQMP
jgi:hypothetical protein